MSGSSDSTESDDITDEPKKWKFMFRGTDMSQVPCFKETAMNTIGASALIGIGYNFATSRNPTRLVSVVLPIAFFGTW
jgi:hypothetical protein